MQVKILKTNIFLTGQIQVGKSTLIYKLLASDEFANADIRGFRTLNRGKDVYLMDAMADVEDCTEENICGERILEGAGNMPTPYLDVFNNLGTSLLGDIDDADIVVMDELGFLESEAYVFRERIVEILDSEKPVLGVLKKKPTEFLDSVRDRDDVEVIEITSENRLEQLEYVKKLPIWENVIKKSKDKNKKGKPRGFYGKDIKTKMGVCLA